MRTLLEHTCDSTCEGTRAERACGGTANGSSRGASARHSAMRCACRHGVWEGAVGRESRPTAPASHVDDEACVSFCMLREGKSANDRREHAGCHTHHASGSFVCRESFSVYSAGMATSATLATLGADLLRVCSRLYVSNKFSHFRQSLRWDLRWMVRYHPTSSPFVYFQDSI